MDIFVSVATLKTRGVKREGYLVKQGFKVKSWKKRYFVLVETPAPCLYYFKSPKDLQEAGKIPVDSSTIVKPTFSLDKKHIMEIVTADRTYQMTDDDSSVVDDWITAVNSLLGKKLRSLSDPEMPNDVNIMQTDAPIAKILMTRIKACKDFFPSLSQLIDLSNSYKSKLSAVSESAKSISDLMYAIGSGGGHETATGKELCKIATATKQIEKKRDELRNVYIDQFVIKFQSTIEAGRNELDALEKKVKITMNDVGKDVAKARAVYEKAKKKNAPTLSVSQGLYESKQQIERSTLENCLREVLEFQETRQRALLVSYTIVIDALEQLVEAENKLVHGNERWRTESARPVQPAMPDANVLWPSPPAASNDDVPASYSIPAQTSPAPLPPAMDLNNVPPPVARPGAAPVLSPRSGGLPPLSAMSGAPQFPTMNAALPPPINSGEPYAPSNSSADAPAASGAPPPPPPPNW